MTAMTTLTVPRGYYRFCGILLMLGGLMGAAGQLMHAPDTPESVAAIPEFLNLAVNMHVQLAWASTLILLGLSGLYLRQAAGLRFWGWLSLPLLFIGLMLEIFHGPVQILGYPIMYGNIQDEAALKIVNDGISHMAIDRFPLQLAVTAPILPCILLGFLLLAFSTLKARILPKGPAIFNLVVLVILILGMFIKAHFFEVSFSYIHLAIVYYGFTLFSSVSSSAATGQRAAARTTA